MVKKRPRRQLGPLGDNLEHEETENERTQLRKHVQPEAGPIDVPPEVSGERKTARAPEQGVKARRRRFGFRNDSRS